MSDTPSEIAVAEEHDSYNLIALPSIRWTPQPWREKAKCLGMDNDIFFNSLGNNVEKAKKICRQCPVQRQCLEWASEEQVNHGIFGGRSPLERRHFRKGASNWMVCGTRAGIFYHEENEEKLCPACMSAKHDKARKKVNNQAYIATQRGAREQREDNDD
jgi:WhiB family redox-sensing transcriptional regulator